MVDHQPTPTHPETIVTYADGSVSSFNIVGEIAGSGSSHTTQIPNLSNAVEIDIGTDVTSIGDYAFYSCSGLTSVTINNGVTSIGEYAFYECTDMISIIIPSNVTSISIHAFYLTKNLTNIYVEKTMQQVTNMNYSDWFEFQGYRRTVTIFCTDGQLTVTVYSGPLP